MSRTLALAFMSWIVTAAVAGAQDQPRPASQCQAIAEATPKASFVSFKPQETGSGANHRRRCAD